MLDNFASLPSKCSWLACLYPVLSHCDNWLLSRTITPGLFRLGRSLYSIHSENASPIPIHTTPFISYDNCHKPFSLRDTFTPVNEIFLTVSSVQHSDIFSFCWWYHGCIKPIWRYPHVISRLIHVDPCHIKANDLEPETSLVMNVTQIIWMHWYFLEHPSVVPLCCVFELQLMQSYDVRSLCILAFPTVL